MRDATNVSIQELIIHILDPQGQGLVLSSVAVPLKGNEALVDYFSSHLLVSLKDPSIKAARFRNINPEQTSGVCRALLRGETTLVEGSRRLAQELFAILERDQRITPGDLAVCFFKAENYPYTRFLAIMKIDPSQIFSHVVRQDKRGNTYVSFEANAQAFTAERLQKCAFIQPLEPRHPEFDMLLLDRQRKTIESSPAGSNAIAQFFSESFLDAQEAYDARKLTGQVYRSLVGVENKLRDRLTEEENEHLEERVQQAVTSRRLNLDSWLESLPLSPELKQEIDQTVSARMPAREFTLDRAFSQQLVSKIKFRGDHGMRLEVPAENYFTLVVSEERITDDPERPPYYRIVIETDDWKRIA
jgi:hypothetical protein